MKMKRIGRKWAAAAMALAAGVMTAGAVEPVLDNLPGAPAQSRSYWEAVRAEAAAKKAADKAKAASTATATAQFAGAGGDFFTGKPYDADLGGYVFKYRTYDPHLGRWTTPDPSGFPDGANGYGYTIGSRVLVAVDPLGLKTVFWLLAYSDNDSNDERQEAYTELNNAQTDFRNEMLLEDIFSAAMGSPTDYVIDGDTFSFGAINSIGALANYNTADQVYIAAHGCLDGTFKFGDFWATEAQVQSIYGFVKDINGCEYNNVYGLDVLTPFIQPTRDFLYE